MTGLLRVWGAGQCRFGFGGVDTPLPPSTTAIVAVRSRVPSTSNGPFPFGTRVVGGIDQINVNFNLDGIRVGFKNGPLSPVLLTPPVQLYDSRAHVRLSAGKTRTISLASLLPVGAAGSSLAATGVVWGTDG